VAERGKNRSKGGSVSDMSDKAVLETGIKAKKI
jgi:hypothetical protein